MRPAGATSTTAPVTSTPPPSPLRGRGVPPPQKMVVRLPSTRAFSMVPLPVPRSTDVRVKGTGMGVAWVSSADRESISPVTNDCPAAGTIRVTGTRVSTGAASSPLVATYRAALTARAAPVTSVST